VSETGGPSVVSWASPMRMRVYQRQGTVADVPVSVGLSGGADCLQLRVLNADRSVRVGWTEFTNNQNFRFPHGGWYVVEIRAIAGNKTGQVAALDHIGIGDVYVTAGQSNAVFYGESPQKTATGRVAYFDGTDWTLCQDPLQRITPGATGGAPWCLLGDIMVNNYNVPIAFAPVGWPGTTISQWQQGAGSSPGASGELYARLMRTLRHFGANGVRAVLWQQGESEVGITSGETYKVSLLNLVVGSRQEVNYPVKWFVSRSTFPWDWVNSPLASWQAYSEYVNPQRIQAVENARVQIRLAQEAACGGDVNAVYLGPDTDQAGIAYRYGELHFNNQGIASVGQAWFNSIHPVIAR